MVKSLLVALPMLVCAIFALQLLLTWWRHRDAAQGWLGVWASVTTLLYAGHFLYFHRAMDLSVVSHLYQSANRETAYFVPQAVVGGMAEFAVVGFSCGRFPLRFDVEGRNSKFR